MDIWKKGGTGTDKEEENSGWEEGEDTEIRISRETLSAPNNGKPKEQV